MVKCNFWNAGFYISGYKNGEVFFVECKNVQLKLQSWLSVIYRMQSSPTLAWLCVIFRIQAMGTCMVTSKWFFCLKNTFSKLLLNNVLSCLELLILLLSGLVKSVVSSLPKFYTSNLHQNNALEYSLQ